jgi:putative transposase
MIVHDKGAISDAAGATTRWSQFGAPELMVADHDPAFMAIDFTDACNDIGITLERTISGVPAMQGTIERFFRTCATNLASWFSERNSSDVCGDRPAEHRACLGPDDLSHVLVRWTVDTYHNTPHSGLGGLTPLQQWEEDLGDPARPNDIASAVPAPRRNDDA